MNLVGQPDGGWPLPSTIAVIRLSQSAGMGLRPGARVAAYFDLGNMGRDFALRYQTAGGGCIVEPSAGNRSLVSGGEV